MATLLKRLFGGKQKVSSPKDCFIFDIDGTLADKGTRSPYDESLVIFDTPITPVCKVMLQLRKKYTIIFVSGRTENCRKDTLHWLSTVMDVEKDEIILFMRKANDRRRDSIIKKEIYDENIIPFYNIIGVFDDRMQVCRMLYDNDIFCFNVNQHLIEF